MSQRKSHSIRRDWISKTLAGVVMGGVMAFACSGLFSQLNGSMPLSARRQLAMWMVVPIWLCVLSTVYFFASGVRAWLWLGGFSLLIASILFALRIFQFSL